MQCLLACTCTCTCICTRTCTHMYMYIVCLLVCVFEFPGVALAVVCMTTQHASARHEVFPISNLSDALHYPLPIHLQIGSLRADETVYSSQQACLTQWHTFQPTTSSLERTCGIFLSWYGGGLSGWDEHGVWLDTPIVRQIAHLAVIFPLMIS